MDAPVTRPNILHLNGVTMDDFVPIEEVFDEKVLENVESAPDAEESSPHDKIPEVFTGVKNWPTSTNLRCWSCVFSFDGHPCFIPTSVRESATKGIEIGVEGNFCTFNCAARYIDDMYPPQAHAIKNWQMRDNLCLVYSLFTGHRPSHISPAPAKTDRREFGGELSEDDFWAKLRELDPQFGLRDHRPGTVIPERLRPPSGKSVWAVCGVEEDEVSGTEKSGKEESGTEESGKAEDDELSGTEKSGKAEEDDSGKAKSGKVAAKSGKEEIPEPEDPAFGQTTDDLDDLIDELLEM